MSQPRPHLLYIAWGYPPSRGGGVYRALATANAFAAAGWDVTVLTADERTFHRFTGSDESLLLRIDPSITVERVPFSWPAQETDPAEFSLLRRLLPRVWRRVRKRLDTIGFPEVAYGPWRRPLQRRAREIHRAHPVDLTIATANPNVTFAAAHHLHRRAKVPYVMDYRDAWLLDVFSGARVHAAGSRAARLESRYISSATEVWFVNAPIRDWHAELYPAAADRMHVVANGWDPELAPETREPRTTPHDRLVFGYLGTLSPKVPLKELLDGWALAVQPGSPLAGARLEFHGYLGYYATPRAELLEEIEQHAGEGASYEGPVNKTDISAVYESFDILVLALGTGRYVTSGKVFEYLATGKPIVSVHDSGNAASDVLAGYPLWFPTKDLSESSIAAALNEAAGALQRHDPEVQRSAATFAAEYRRDRQLMPRVRELGLRVGLGTVEQTDEAGRV